MRNKISRISKDDLTYVVKKKKNVQIFLVHFILAFYLFEHFQLLLSN